MNNTQRVFSDFDPLIHPISGMSFGILRTAEQISKHKDLPLDMVSGILNDSKHAFYIKVLPRSGTSPVYQFNFSQFIIKNFFRDD